MDYLAIRLIHILSATVLFGTGLGTAFFMWQAHRSANPQATATVARNVVLADWLFTTPAVITQPLSGFWLMQLRGYDFTSTWLWLTLVLYLIAGACWLPVVRLQIRVRNMARAAVAQRAPLPESYYRHMRWWFRLGMPAFSAMLLIFYLMVFRPS